MRINNAASGRPAYYDRNPALNLVATYAAAAVAPHAQTQRTSYTVPSNTKTMITLASLNVLRTTAATGVGKARIYAILGGNIVLLTQIHAIAQSTADKNAAAPQHLMVAGNTCSIYTDDVSTGGSNDYDATIMGFEFNA